MTKEASFGSYEELVQTVKDDYQHRSMEKDSNGKLPPKWHNLDLTSGNREEINLWTYWQGVGVTHPKLMVVGQDWGCMKGQNQTIKCIEAIACDNSTDTQYLDNRHLNDNRDFTTDNNLIKIFKDLGRDIEHKRYSDLFFTNLCLGYRQDATSGYFKQKWMTEDAEKYFPALVKLMQPEAIVCLGEATAKTAYRVLEGKPLLMPEKFKGFLDNQTAEGIPLSSGIKFFAMAHPGGMGRANRSRWGGDIFKDWTILRNQIR
ncbi:hypothetical protein [Adlercreutzia sp. ZJ154]|uniref:hypothetical protein n=1 Tax=Adlercreutzia sp. ZJ154 TaxID=2709790 RepID=UPI0013ED9EF8|nr:hypothetical protein [Adlercreutzia sp. ZJ154]